MRNIGRIIKLERKRLNMKQVILAKGICSTSYLSKIENETTKASKEVIDLLLNRLNISLTETNDTLQDSAIRKELSTTYQTITVERNKKYAAKRLAELENKNIVAESTVFYFYQLVILRLYISTRNKNACIFYIDFLTSEYNRMTNSQKYLFKKSQGIYYYQVHMLEQSLHAFDEALHISYDVQLEDWEKADFYYMLSISYCENGNILGSIKFAKKALNFFKDSFQFQRMIDTYILLGVDYKRGNQLEQAHQTFQLALESITKLNIEYSKGIIYHNIGTIYSLNNSEKAILFYKKSLDYKTEPNDKLITIFSGVKEYSKQNNKESMKEWVEKGLQVIRDSGKMFSNYHYHFLIYDEIYLHGLITEETALPVIKFFEDQKNHRYCYKYSTLLGDSFFQKGRYKQAALHYQKAQSYLFNTMKINNLEDF